MSELDTFAFRLLDFAVQSIDEGRNDPNPATAIECLREADHAIGILKKSLSEEDIRFFKISLLSVFDTSFARIFEGMYSDAEHSMKEALRHLITARSFFQ